jgi:hypothetical protein
MDVSGQIHAPAVLHPEKYRGYPLDRWSDEPQSRSGNCEEKNVYCLKSNLGSPARPACRFTDWAILTPNNAEMISLN